MNDFRALAGRRNQKKGGGGLTPQLCQVQMFPASAAISTKTASIERQHNEKRLVLLQALLKYR